MSEVVWTEAADRDLQRHFDFLNAVSPDAASGAVRAILNAGASLSRSPYRGTAIDVPTGLRRLVVSFGKYGFVLHYQVLEVDALVVIVRVYHGREDRPN
jgi:plasmid stabilization system protein ParE